MLAHPGWASANSWTYAGTSFVSAGATSDVTAVAFDVDSSQGQALSRGTMQYSLDHGQTWTSYTAPVDAPGSFMPVAGTLWDSFCWGIEPWDTNKVEAALKKRGLNPVADHSGDDRPAVNAATGEVLE